MSERVVIEEGQVLRKDALKSTVVRWVSSSDSGLWITTVPCALGRLESRLTFEIRVFRFTGYAETNGSPVPNVDTKDDAKLNRWALLDSFEDDPELAVDHHRQVTHEVAAALESGELLKLYYS